MKKEQRTPNTAVVILAAIFIGGACGYTAGDSRPTTVTPPPKSSVQALFAKYGMPPMNEQEESEAERLLTEAVLAQDWNGIVGMLAEVSDANLPVCCRAVKGHACLATNRSNESLELFASLLDNADVLQLQKWSDDLAQRHPDRAIAWYLKGDAHARQRQWRQAEECFDRALQLDTKCYLAWNARGVTAHALGNTLMARMYFNKASTAREDFADAYASLGALSVYSGSALRGNDTATQEWFEKARQNSRNSIPVLPELGMGCVHYRRREYVEAKRCFAEIPDTSDLATIARRNMLCIELDQMLRTLADAKKAGTFVQSKEYELDDGQTATVQESEQGVVVSFTRSNGWGVTGIDIHIPPFITIHWGPKPSPGGEQGGGDDDNGGEGGNSNGGDDGAEKVQSTVGPDIPVLYSQRVIKVIREDGRIIYIDPDTGIVIGTEASANSDDDSSGEQPDSRAIVLNTSAIVSNIVSSVAAEMNREVAAGSTTGILSGRSESRSNLDRYGGVDTDISGISSSGRRPEVSTVYGLLYPIRGLSSPF